MKNRFALLFAILLIFSNSIPAFATDAKKSNTVYIDINQGHRYYDDELGTYVVSFTINSDGSVNYLTELEVDNLTKNKIDEADATFVDTLSKPLRNDYYVYYVFNQIGKAVQVSGSTKKVSADLQAPEGGGSLSKTVSYTSTSFFSANVTSSKQESAIIAGATIGWEESATASTTYVLNLLPGQKGYIGFTPYYDRVFGELEEHSNWGDPVVTREVYGYSVKLTDTNEADGLFSFVEIT